MSVCAHDPYCAGFGPEHDAAALGREGLLSLRNLTPKMLRSGNPMKRAVGQGLLDRVNAALPFLPEKDEK